jgi:hypothetical protein
LIGNLLSFFLMNQSKYRHSTTCFYMRCLAIFDSLYITSRMVLRYPLSAAPGIFQQRELKKYYCLIYFSFSYYSLVHSPLILTVMALDRFIALQWPLKAAVMCTMRRARRSVFGVTSFGVVIGGLQFLRTYQRDLESWYCPYHFEIAGGIFDQTFAVIYTYFPMVCIIICNAGVIQAVYRSRQEHGRLSVSQAHRPSSTAEGSITRTTILVTCLFIVSNIPMRLEDSFWSFLNHDAYSIEMLQAQILTFVNFAILSENLNYCLNFYLYGLSCRRFRRELLLIVTCRSEQSEVRASSKKTQIKTAT